MNPPPAERTQWRAKIYHWSKVFCSAVAVGLVLVLVFLIGTNIYSIANISSYISPSSTVALGSTQVAVPMKGASSSLKGIEVPPAPSNTDVLGVLSLIAAVVTLLLTLGSTWLNKEIERLEEKHRTLDSWLKNLQEIDDRRQDVWNCQLRLAECRRNLPQVLYELHDSRVSDRWNRSLALYFDCQVLESDDINVRFLGFNSLTEQLKSLYSDSSIANLDDLPEKLVLYFEACELKARLSMHSATMPTWCRPDSSLERKAHFGKFQSSAKDREASIS